VAPLIAPRLAGVLGVNDKVQLAELGHCIAPSAHASSCWRRDAGGSGAHRRARRSHRRSRRVHRRQRLLEGKVSIAIGADRANVVLRNVSVDAGHVIHPNCVIEQSSVGPDNSIGRSRASAGFKDGREVQSAISWSSRRPRCRWQQGQPPHLPGRLAHRQEGSTSVRAHHGNYDGANKWQDIIEDGVHIGSTRAGGTFASAGRDDGAGSTITKDAPRPAHAGTMPAGDHPGRKRPVKKPKA
jgi:bifunctional N-acetylglucosamine-1-phosphate-uridyltransferase/glucosamine-1-phosphate-acetyltransferase GlmU-like protein